MSVTNHERPGVYSRYDASTVVKGRGGGGCVGLAALCGTGTAGTLYTFNRYEEAVTAFGGEETLTELVRLLFLNGAAQVKAVPVAEEAGYKAAFSVLEAAEDIAVVVCDSERPVIQTALNVPVESIKELQPGQAMFINKAGKVRTVQINKPREVKPCSFERIYFSRGSDVDIYRERKLLGEKLVPNILKAIDNDVDHTVFSFIPNTAEVAFYGMLQGLDDYLNEEKVQQIAALGHSPSHDELEHILSRRIRSEKVAIKDIKLRTFIAEGNSRNDLAAHVYDITYGSLVPGVDNLVIIDDSIVRGTTLKQSIIGILDRLEPKKIVIVSSSPQVRYPDYYGIDMAKMSEFIAFKAAVELLKEREMRDVIAAAYRKSKEQVGLPKEQMVNYVKEIYAPFTDEEISAKMVELLTPKGTKAKVQIVYQPLEGLHEACPKHPGDWYFSGDYPTPGGVKLLNKAFIDYIEQVYQF